MAKSSQGIVKSGQGLVSSIRSLLPFGESTENATAMLRAEHRMVDELFGEFMATESRARRRTIAAKVIEALRAHTTIEEEIFYPALRRKLDDEEPIACAFEEHGIAKRLLDELERMSPGDTRFNAKFKVLAESVRHHVREEESQILPAAESSDLDLEALAERMRARERELRERRGTKRAGSRPASRARRGKTSTSGRARARRNGAKARAQKASASAKKRATAKKRSTAKKGSARSRRSAAARSRRAG